MKRSVFNTKMISENKASLQSNEQNPVDPSIIADIEYENISKETEPILHQSSRFIFVVNGKGKISIDNSEYEINKNDLISVVPWMITKVTSVSKPLSIYVFKYSHDLFTRNLFDFYKSDSNTDLISKSLSNFNVSYNHETLISTFKKAFELSRKIENTPKNIVNTLFFSYLLEIGSEHANYCSNSNDLDNTNSKEQNILNYIYINSDKKITLNDLSKIFFMSNSNISRYIHSKTNLSFFELLNEIRVKKAMELLIHTNLTNSEISSILGYADKSHFMKNFKSLMYETPQEFRNNYKGKNISNNKNLDSKIIDFIYNNSASNININLLSKIFDMSSIEINKKLKIMVGKTFTELLNYVRINKAAKLILSSEDSITSIAFEVGYNTFKTFYRNFLKIKKMTPREFKNTIVIENKGD